MDSLESYWLYIVIGVGLVSAVIGAAMTQGFVRSRAERRQEKELASLTKGIGHEYRLNLFEALGEFQALTPEHAEGATLATIVKPRWPVTLVPVEPHLHHSAMTSLAPIDHAGLAVMGFGYRELERHKREIGQRLESGQLTYGRVVQGVDEVVKGLALLYLWRHHNGQQPKDLPSIRKRELVTYAREQGLDRFNFPDQELVFRFVDHLRNFGLKVTPVPLVMSAHDYYAMPIGDRGRQKRHAERAARRKAKMAREAERRDAKAKRDAAKAAAKAQEKAAKAARKAHEQDADTGGEAAASS